MKERIFRKSHSLEREMLIKGNDVYSIGKKLRNTNKIKFKFSYVRKSFKVFKFKRKFLKIFQNS